MRSLLLIHFWFLLTFIYSLPAGSQLTDAYFPDRDPSTRNLTNNKRVFKAYRNTTMNITLFCKDVQSAELTLNHFPINLNIDIKKSTNIIELDISKYLRDGFENFISIQNILPKGSFIIAYVPYPILQYGTPESVGINPELLAKVDMQINNDIEKGFPGANLIIIKNGKIIKEQSYGFARKYDDNGELLKEFEKMKINTLFDMASNTKMFATNFAIMKLFDSHLLDYLYPIKNYIPNYKGKDSKNHNRENILVSHLLTHTAGYVPIYPFYDDKRVKCYSRNKTYTEYCVCNKVDLEREKGGIPKYSDIDFILAGFTVEHATGLPLDEYVEKQIYKQIGIKRTCYNPMLKGFQKNEAAATEIFGNTRNRTINFKDIRTKVIQGEVHDENAFYSMNGTSGHAGLFSTINDMAILCQVLLNKGGYGFTRLWSRDTQDLFVKPYDLDMSYGLGWRREGNEYLNWHFGAYASNEAIGHTGWTGTVTVIDPKYDLAVVLLTNKKHSNGTGESFYGDTFETGRFGSVMQLIYESFLNK